MDGHDKVQFLLNKLKSLNFQVIKQIKIYNP